MTATTERSAAPTPVATSKVGRVIDGQTAIDFVGRRKIGFAISSVLIVAAIVSLLAQGLNLGIDFEGGVSWDVPAENGFTVDDAEDVLADNGLSTEGARLQERTSESGDFVKVQVGSEAEDVGAELRNDFAEAAGVEADAVNVTLVSSSWGDEITDKAVRALLIFVVLVMIFISIRFEWRMAVAAIIAMLHDIVISVGIYSMLQFVVTPPTVIAFLTILGYSLYDTIVVFDRVKENETRFAAHKPPYDDVINVSMNQVLMRTLTTTFSSVVPVASMLLIGAGILGQATLSEFALALLIGMLTGTYSSIIVAAPILGLLKSQDPAWRSESRGVPSSGFATNGPQANFAGFWRRLGGGLIDGLILSSPWIAGELILVTALVVNSSLVAVVAVVGMLLGGIGLIVVYCQKVSETGQSWGGEVLGLYIVGAEDGQTVAPARVFWRGVARLLSALVFYLGFFWMLWDDRRQTWHDKLARTVVLGETSSEREARLRREVPRATGESLRTMVMGGGVASRRDRQRSATDVNGDGAVKSDGVDPEVPTPTSKSDATEAKAALSHPPRPRKKKRR